MAEKNSFQESLKSVKAVQSSSGNEFQTVRPVW